MIENDQLIRWWKNEIKQLDDILVYHLKNDFNILLFRVSHTETLEQKHIKISSGYFNFINSHVLLSTFWFDFSFCFQALFVRIKL